MPGVTVERAAATSAIWRLRLAWIRVQKARKGPGVLTAECAASISKPRTWAWPWRPIRPVRAGVPGLAHARIEAQIADKVAGGREAADVADHAYDRERRDHPDAGDRHQPSQVRVGERLFR